MAAKVEEVAEQMAGLCEKFPNPYPEPWQDSDAVLIIEGERVHIHSLLLSFASPVFKKRFENSKEIIINDFSMKEVSLLLCCVYHNKNIEDELTGQTEFEKLIKFVDEFDIKVGLRTAVDKFIKDNIKPSIEMLQFSDLHNLPQAMKFFSSNLARSMRSKLITHEAYKTLSEQTKYYISKECNKCALDNFNGMVALMDNKTRYSLRGGHIHDDYVPVRESGRLGTPAAYTSAAFTSLCNHNNPYVCEFVSYRPTGEKSNIQTGIQKENICCHAAAQSGICRYLKPTTDLLTTLSE